MKSGKVISALALAAVVISCDSPKSGSGFDGKLDDEAKQFSYAIGMEVGQSLKGIGTDINIASFSAGVEAVLAGQTAILSDSAAGEIKGVVFRRLQQDRMTKDNAESVKNAETEKTFLAGNKAKEGIITTGSGLQYQIVTPGTGAMPTASDKVKVHYRGTLLDGTEFDNSYTRKEPAVFGVTQVIPGWSEGLQLMKIGGKYKLWVPAQLGYGARRMGEKIPPNSCLIFEVELLEIMK